VTEEPELFKIDAVSEFNVKVCPCEILNDHALVGIIMLDVESAFSSSVASLASSAAPMPSSNWSTMHAYVCHKFGFNLKSMGTS
jgi:hypothetical protein